MQLNILGVTSQIAVSAVIKTIPLWIGGKLCPVYNMGLYWVLYCSASIIVQFLNYIFFLSKDANLN